jgi:hypothetical protein
MDEHATPQARIRAAWIDLLLRNRGAEGHPDQYYALRVENIQGHGAAFELCLTFRAGRIYCCCEDMCHTGVFTEKRGGNCGRLLPSMASNLKSRSSCGFTLGSKQARDCTTARAMSPSPRCAIKALGR